MSEIKLLYVENAPDPIREMENCVRQLGSGDIVVHLEIAKNATAACKLIRAGALDAAIIDYGLPGKRGDELFEDIRAFDKGFPCVILTAKGNEELAVRLMHNGLNDYMKKPITQEKLQQCLLRLLQVIDARRQQQELTGNLEQVRAENVQLRERLGIRSEIIGQSTAVRQVSEEIAKAAPSNATVLIRGESGVGKELVARAVHYNGPRRDNVFVCLNCAALSTELLASELFGHERGAFTGATERKIGKFEAAHKGTLMLDEIGEMSPGLQAKFLRVLEGHPFERVGGSKPIKVDVRVIAATNRDLERDVTDGRFRRDLYFRLRVLEIVVPALRKRHEDIPLLADYFLEKFNAETGRKIKGFTSEAKEQLLKYLWPGNVRELKNVIERAVVLCRGQEIGAEDLLLTKLATDEDSLFSDNARSPQQDAISALIVRLKRGQLDKKGFFAEAERHLIQWAIQETDGVVTEGDTEDLLLTKLATAEGTSCSDNVSSPEQDAMSTLISQVKRGQLDKKGFLAEAERHLIQWAIQEADGVVTEAAHILRVTPKTIHGRLTHLGMRSKHKTTGFDDCDVPEFSE